MKVDPFNFSMVDEGPVEPTLVPGFGGTGEITRVIDDGLWVELVSTRGGFALWDWSPTFESDSEAREWLTNKQ